VHDGWVQRIGNVHGRRGSGEDTQNGDALIGNSERSFAR
jgi:hypothetical protein